MTNVKIDRTKKFKGFRSFKGQLCNTTISFWKMLFEENGIEFEAWYQRDYVWSEKEQQAFLTTLVSGFPVGVIAVVNDPGKEEKWVELVDGKQRITTLKMFFDNKIPCGDVYYQELDPVEQRLFHNIGLPYYDLNNGTEKDKLDFFYRVNFTGIAQSEEHRKFIEDSLLN